MKKHRSLLIVLLLAATTAATAQHITFASEEIEYGVKRALGLAAEDVVPTAIADTLTTLSLRGLGLTDVDDLLYFPSLRTLDLADNELESIKPLQLLDSLHVLDVSRNKLESIDMLYFSQSDSMRVNVSWNHIDDFSIFYSFSHCRFSIDGLYLQTMKDEPVYDIYHLYSDLDDNDAPYLYYRIVTNCTDSTTLQYEGHTARLDTDGQSRFFHPDETLTATTMAVVTCSSYADTTYFVPAMKDDVAAGETKCYDFGLPDDYTFGFLHCQHGELKGDGQRLEYIASDTLTTDVILFSYLKGNTLKGFSKITINEGYVPDLVAWSEERLTLRNTGPGRLLVDGQAPWLGDTATLTILDIVGRQVSTTIVDSRHGIHKELYLPDISGQTVIVQIDSNKQTRIRKTFVE